jgi:hypothetical protein
LPNQSSNLILCIMKIFMKIEVLMLWQPCSGRARSRSLSRGQYSLS